jgi:integrase
MPKRPRTRKHHNLTLRKAKGRAPTIYAEIVLGGKQHRKSMGTADWDAALVERDRWMAELLQQTAPEPVRVVQGVTFGEAADAALERERHRLKGTTWDDHDQRLRPARPAGLTYAARPAGALRRAFGDLPLDALDHGALLEWWEREIIGRGRSVKTGRNALDSLALVFKWARQHGHLDRERPDPAQQLRATLAEDGGTAKDRAASDPGAKVKPLSAGEVMAFLAASRASSHPAHALLDLLLLDADLRIGEAVALEWPCVVWGDGPDDPRRHLRIEQSESRGRHLTTPKSGRSRTVHLSQRLWLALRERWEASGGQGRVAATWVKREERFRPLDAWSYRRHHFAGCCTAAGIGARDPKDLRDTYASQLLTAGVQLGYISRQLGHADVAVTARHYAKWCSPDDTYREPLRLRPGEVPADLLARLEPTESAPRGADGAHKWEEPAADTAADSLAVRPC